jgi:hypothetical protein
MLNLCMLNICMLAHAQPSTLTVMYAVCVCVCVCIINLCMPTHAQPSLLTGVCAQPSTLPCMLTHAQTT